MMQLIYLKNKEINEERPSFFRLGFNMRAKQPVYKPSARRLLLNELIS